MQFLLSGDGVTCKPVPRFDNEHASGQFQGISIAIIILVFTTIYRSFSTAFGNMARFTTSCASENVKDHKEEDDILPYTG
jgi:hypothetical protein